MIVGDLKQSRRFHIPSNHRPPKGGGNPRPWPGGWKPGGGWNPPAVAMKSLVHGPRGERKAADQDLRGPPGGANPGGGPKPARSLSVYLSPHSIRCFNLRGPPGGAPRPAKPGGAPGKPPGGKPGKPPGGGGGPPTPAAGPPRPTGRPRPAGLLMPGPAERVAAAEATPGTLDPKRDEGSAGGGPSTEHETT